MTSATNLGTAPNVPMLSSLLHCKLIIACVLVCTTSAAFADGGLDAVQELLTEHCVACHNPDEKNGGVDLEALVNAEKLQPHLNDWVKVERAISRGIMPPEDEPRLSDNVQRNFSEWFQREFVMPGGIQHAGLSRPRRLTREELQNTLEDLLHVDIRESVTNSRLHVIPETVIEKFFAAGVRGGSGFSNDAITLNQESINIQTCARCFAVVLSLLDSDEAAREFVFGMSDVPAELPSADARDMIHRFCRSAFRREVDGSESAPFVGVYEKQVADATPYEALKSSFLAVLLSPRFLYRFEQPVAAQAAVPQQELAVRLSYFLWSAPPDETLQQLAADGQLQNEDVLRQQVRRMLADPRRVAIAENLGGEWFDYKTLRRQSAVNKRSDRMAGFYRTQWEEALLFFDSIIRFDQPLFSLVDADWAWSNRHQSGIYRLSTGAKKFDDSNDLPPISIHFRDAARTISQGNYEYKHQPLELVALTDPNRGGFITLGPTLSVTSTPNRTSPIRRGVWVMERILGEHFEVPEDVPDLESTQEKAKSQKLKLSHVELLKLHSSQPGCASCHQYIDPIGFGLEGYDQLGIGRPESVSNPAGEKLFWTPKETTGTYADQTWTLRKPLVPGGETKVYFNYTKGRHRLDIRNVRLHAGEVELLDKHFGYTGNAQRDNVWLFSLPADAPDTGWQLTAEIKGDGGGDSHGTISVAGPNDKPDGHRLPNGKSFSSPAELKKILLTDYRDQVIDNAVRRVLAYALGRRLEPIDRPAIRQIKDSIRGNGYRMTDLIEAVALSYPFRHKEFELVE